MMISKIETDTLTIPARCSTGFTRKHRAIIEFIRMKRTTNFDAWAEVEHELIYKSHIAPLDTPLRRKLAAINATLTLSDITFQEIRDYQRQLHKELYKRRLSFAAEHPGQIQHNNHNKKTFHETSEKILGKNFVYHSLLFYKTRIIAKLQEKI